MKKTLSLVLTLAMLLTFACTLAACGKKGPLDGTFESEVKLGSSPYIILKFDGNTFEYNVINDVQTLSYKTLHGTFTMEGNTVKLQYENGKTDSFYYDPSADTLDWMEMGELILRHTSK